MDLFPLFQTIISVLQVVMSYAGTQRLIELDLRELSSFVVQPRARIVCFYRNEGSSLPLPFLGELEEAAAYLHSQEDYGIRIAKVNCGEHQDGFCKDDLIKNNIMVFRGDQKLSLSTTSLPDRHAIIASVLHLSLVEQVPIVRSLRERRRLEEACTNDGHHMVFLYVTQFGTREHRALMELAFPLSRESNPGPRSGKLKEGESWLCAVTARAEVTKGLQKPSSWEEEGEGSEALLWVLWCQDQQGDISSCSVYLHWGAIDLLHVAAFVEAFARPKWSHAVVTNSGRLVSDFDDLGILLAYVLYRAEDGQEVKMAKSCAQMLSDWYRGSLGVSLLSYKYVNATLREMWSLDESKSQAVVFVDQIGPSHILVNGYGIRFEFVRDLLDERRRLGVSAFREDVMDRPEEEPIPQLEQDDPVSLAASRLSPLEEASLMQPLTDDTVKDYLSSNNPTALLFYLSWDPASMLAERLLESSLRDILSPDRSRAAKVDCFDWTDVCQEHGVASFPTLRVYRQGTVSAQYHEIWQKEHILHFLFMTTLFENPIEFNSLEEVEEYVEGRGPYSHLHKVTFYLAAIHRQDTDRLTAFRNLSRQFSGKHLFALPGTHLVNQTASRMDTSVPMMTAIRRTDVFKPRSLLRGFKTDDCLSRLVSFVEQSRMNIFPELNTWTFKQLWRKDSPLVGLFFRQDGGSQEAAFQMLGTMSANQKENLPIPFSWIDRRSILASKTLSTLGLASEEPLLIVVGVNKVYVYNGTWESRHILDWTRSILAGRDIPSVAKVKASWGPPQKDFEFLLKMEMEEADRFSEEAYPEDDTPKQCSDFKVTEHSEL